MPTLPPVIKNFLIYSSGTVILKSISVLLMPFILHVLPPSQYGLLSLALSFTNILVIITGLGLRQTFGIEYFHHDSVGRRRMANEIIALYLIINSPLFLLALYNLPLLNKILFMGTASTTLMLLCMIYCFLQFFTELFYQLLRYQCKAVTLTVTQIGAALATLLLNLFFLYRFSWGISGMLFGYTIGNVIPFFYAVICYVRAGCLPKILKSHPPQKSSLLFYPAQLIQKKLGYYLRISLPFIPGMLFNWLLVAGNRWLLAHYGSLHDVGIYALADTFGQLYSSLILYPLAGSYLPSLMHQFAQNKNAIPTIEKKNHKIMYLSMLGMTILISCGAIIGKPLAHWLLPARYSNAIGFIWFILIGQVFLMGNYFASALIQFHKKSLFLAGSLIAPALINIGISAALIKPLGIYGCVTATLIAYSVYFASAVFYNKKLQKVSYVTPAQTIKKYVDKTIPHSPNNQPAQIESIQRNMSAEKAPKQKKQTL